MLDINIEHFQFYDFQYLTYLTNHVTFLNSINFVTILKIKIFVCNIIIIMNFTTDQSCNHAVFKFSKYVRKSERSKNLHLNLLYTHCSFSAVCSNHLASVMSTFLDLSFLNSC